MDESESHGFVEEIDYNELIFGEVVGRGTFGIVSKASWRGDDVAVKLIETENEKKAFLTELKQLSRVCHPNIVKLYGACTQPPQICLVMEYAEGGSLYNVLHCIKPLVSYTVAHAISWLLQTAQALDYLHSMKPKPLIHRDVKPPNLLLVKGGTVLKICDFGTACDLQTYMTNNKGSAAWMAPEVFEGRIYSEKCDVFSWGIILWEVLSRRKPFDDEVGGPAFRIMWAIHNGKRPPLIRDMPKPLESLMTTCWAAAPHERPSMSEVVRVIMQIFKFFSGSDKPLRYPRQDRPVVDAPSPISTVNTESSGIGLNYTNRTGLTAFTNRSTLQTEPEAEYVPVPTLPATIVPPVVVEELDSRVQKSAPASLATSRENLENRSRSSTPVSPEHKRYSADLSKLDELNILSLHGATSAPKLHHQGHRRTGSYGNTPVSNNINLTPFSQSPSPNRHSPRPVTPQSAPSATAAEAPPLVVNFVNKRSFSHPPEMATPAAGLTVGVSSNNNNNNKPNDLLRDESMRPLRPIMNNPESMNVYYDHCQLAHEFFRVETEIDVLTERNRKLDEELSRSVTDIPPSEHRTYQDLCEENGNLMLIHEDLKRQVEQYRAHRVPKLTA